jgi:acetyltransferase-like isoleucine patch superfamily enzyme
MNVSDLGTNSIVNIDETVSGNISIDIYGCNNKLVIQKSTAINGYKLELRGNNCSIEIGESCFLNGIFRCRSDDSHIKIGSHTTMMNSRITCHEAGIIDIGVDCMFAGSVQMDNSDMHSIIDKTSGQRINKAANIIIGNHVWLAEGVTVAKGCTIGSGSIAGAKAFVRGKVPENVIVAGVPAKIIRSNIDWC